MADNYGQLPGGGGSGEGIKDQDRLMPIANVGRILKQVLPPNTKVSKEAKETMQECVSEFISFVTGEASDKCYKEKRKTVNGNDVCWAFSALGFDDYVDPMRRHLLRFRELQGDRARSMPPDGHFMYDAMDRGDNNNNNNNGGGSSRQF